MSWTEANRVVGAREFLQSPEGATPDEYISQMIEDHLPANWRALIHKYGHRKVFECLRTGHTIGGASYHCIMGIKPEPRRHMNREKVIDRLREELKRQEKDEKVSVVLCEQPDSFYVIGVIDVHKLAEAVVGER